MGSASASAPCGPRSARFFSRLFGRRNRIVISGDRPRRPVRARRFGGTKQLVALSGTPLAQHAVDALASAGVDEVVVVTGHDADAVERALDAPSAGPLRSEPGSRVRPVLVARRRSARARRRHRRRRSILLADQPGVTDAEVRALIDAFERSGGAASSGSPTRTAPARRCSRARSTRRPDTCTATSAPGRSSLRIPTGSRRSRSPSARLRTSTARRILPGE